MSTGTAPAASPPAPAVATAAARMEAGTKVYGEGPTAVHALDGVDVTFAAAAFTAIMGPSGSGKSTLMQATAGLDRLTSGRVWLGETEITDMDERRLTRVRRERVGFIFQAYNLLPTLSVRENILLPLEIAGRRPDAAWVDEVVGAVGLGDRLRHRPAELSGGQQQRVAAARALIARPAVVFADEPTGALDSRTGAELLALLRRAVREMGQTVVMVTHDPTAAAHADRVVFLADGRIVDEMADPTAARVLDRMKTLGDPS